MLGPQLGALGSAQQSENASTPVTHQRMNSAGKPPLAPKRKAQTATNNEQKTTTNV